jgi:hypothetical protein
MKDLFFPIDPIDQKDKYVQKAEEKAEQYLKENVERMANGAVGIVDVFSKEINEKEFDSILVDDTRAHLHGLLMRDVINSLYGDKRIGTFFVKADSHKEKAFLDYLDKIKEKLGRRVLVVTEEINSGSRVRFFKEILDSLGIACDIATFSLANPFDKDTLVEKRGNGYLVRESDGFTYGYGDGLGVIGNQHAQYLIGVEQPDNDESVIPIKTVSPVGEEYVVEIDANRFREAGRRFVKSASSIAKQKITAPN